MMLKVGGRCRKSALKIIWKITETILKCLKWSNKCSYVVSLRYQTNIWKLKSTGMWSCVTVQVVPDVAKYHSAFKMWGTTYPTLQHNILGDLICSNATIQTPNLAHTNSCNCHVSMQSGCVWNISACKIAWRGKRTFVLIKDARIFKTNFPSRDFEILLRAQCIFKFFYKVYSFCKAAGIIYNAGKFGPPSWSN